MEKQLDSYKWDKSNEIYRAFKTALDSDTIQSNGLTVGTENDLEAYKKLYDIMLDSEKVTIKDRLGAFKEATKIELFSVIRDMTLFGVGLWKKKEMLLYKIDIATTIEEVEAVVW